MWFADKWTASVIVKTQEIKQRIWAYWLWGATWERNIQTLNI